MRGLGSLLFWALLSLSAVVVNSYGQQPIPTATAPYVQGVVPPTVVQPPAVQRNMPTNFPAAAQKGYSSNLPQGAVVSSPVPTVLPKGFIAFAPTSAPTSAAPQVGRPLTPPRLPTLPH